MRRGRSPGWVERISGCHVWIVGDITQTLDAVHGLGVEKSEMRTFGLEWALAFRSASTGEGLERHAFSTKRVRESPASAGPLSDTWYPRGDSNARHEV